MKHNGKAATTNAQGGRTLLLLPVPDHMEGSSSRGCDGPRAERASWLGSLAWPWCSHSQWEANGQVGGP